MKVSAHHVSGTRLVVVVFVMICSVALVMKYWQSDTQSKDIRRFSTETPARSQPATGSGKSNPSSVESDVQRSDTAVVNDASHRSSYEPYLDSICPRLSTIQEDKILAESMRDPRVLAGLALMGSSRANSWLVEALRKAPSDPLVLYAILTRNDPGFDRLRLARELVKILPNDGESFYAAANESMKAGDRDTAIAFLREAVQRDNYSSLYQIGVESKLNVYRLAGYPEQSALARIYLDAGTTLADLALVDLKNSMEPFGRTYEIAPGNEEVAALLLDGVQNSLAAPGRSLTSSFIFREMELTYLRAFLRLAQSENDAPVSRYLNTQPAELLAAATAEKKEFYPLGYFASDKPGIYERLTSEERIQLIERVQRDGEVPAFQWAYQQRPDIFRSPNFKPHMLSQLTWDALIQEIPE